MALDETERIWPTREGEAASRRLHPAEWARYEFAAARGAGKRVLDCACGAGYGAALIAARGALRVVGVDVDPAAVEWARGHFAVGAVEFLHADGARLPLPDASVELAISFETVEHVEEPRRFLAELARVLAPGGELVVSTPLTFGEARLKPANPFHRREYDDVEFEALVAERFAVVERLGQHSAAARRFAELKTVPALGMLVRAGLHRLLPERLRAAGRKLLGRRAQSGPAAWISAERWREAPVQILVARARGAGS
jgi:ubiquinone/menaquinone biosynthesis C-methylase UbiE